MITRKHCLTLLPVLILSIVLPVRAAGAAGSHNTDASPSPGSRQVAPVTTAPSLSDNVANALQDRSVLVEQLKELEHSFKQLRKCNSELADEMYGQVQVHATSPNVVGAGKSMVVIPAIPMPDGNISMPKQQDNLAERNALIANMHGILAKIRMQEQVAPLGPDAQPTALWANVTDQTNRIIEDFDTIVQFGSDRVANKARIARSLVSIDDRTKQAYLDCNSMRAVLKDKSGTRISALFKRDRASFF